MKLTKSTQIFYGLGVSYAIVDQIFAQWILYFYLPPESSGLKPIMAPASYFYCTGNFKNSGYDNRPNYWIFIR